MAVKNKKITERTSYFGAQTDNKYETDIKGISSAINNISATTDRSYIPGTNPPIEEVVQALSILFDDIANANTLVGDASSVEDWNTFFDLPTNGGPFTSVEIVGNEVKLYGGSNITIKTRLFVSNTNLISVNDEAGCVVYLERQCFDSSSNLTSVNFPEVVTGDNECFYYATSLVSINFPKLEVVDFSFFEGCEIIETISLPKLTVAAECCTFYSCNALTALSIPSCTTLGNTVGDNYVFSGISGNTITLTVPASRMTCNSGNPDGDIQYLQANNTVTVVTV